VNITDAKPKLPPGATHVFVTFDEVSVHKAGGDWISLPVVPPAPHTIDLLQFSNGGTTQLVPPVQLTSGKYTQLRLGVTGGSIVFDTNDDGKDDETVPLEVPSDSLKTDKNFEFEVHGGGAVDLTVEFDLSQSIVVTGSGKYKLKPVLHINYTEEAATIRGSIPAAAFGSATEATVTVWWDKKEPPDTPDAKPSCSLNDADEIYTQVVVEKADPNFEIFWLVPNEAYIVEIDVGEPVNNKFFFTVPGLATPTGPCQEVQPGVIYDLGLATIQGKIATPFNGAAVTVIWDKDASGTVTPGDLTYTQLPLPAAVSGPPVAFSISVFANQPYVVQVVVNGTLKHQEAVPADALPAGATFPLNGDNPI
jgi:hypothetical protein